MRARAKGALEVRGKRNRVSPAVGDKESAYAVAEAAVLGKGRRQVTAAEVVAAARERGEEVTGPLVEAMRAERLVEWGEPARDPFERVYRGLAPIAIDVMVKAMFSEKVGDQIQAAKDIQDRAGLSPVKKVAQKIQIELSERTIEALKRAAVVVKKE